MLLTVPTHTLEFARDRDRRVLEYRILCIEDNVMKYQFKVKLKDYARY